MKEIKLKLIIILTISTLGCVSLFFTYKMNSTYESKLTPDQISLVKKSLNSVLNRGCSYIHQSLSFNEAKNFVSARIGNLELKGSVYGFKSIQDLSLYEFNLESKLRGIKFRGYLFEKTENKSCFGKVL